MKPGVHGNPGFSRHAALPRADRLVVFPATIGDFMGIGAFLEFVGNAWLCAVIR
jgi:hypothetical protein